MLEEEAQREELISLKEHEIVPEKAVDVRDNDADTLSEDDHEPDLENGVGAEHAGAQDGVELEPLRLMHGREEEQQLQQDLTSLGVVMAVARAVLVVRMVWGELMEVVALSSAPGGGKPRGQAVRDLFWSSRKGLEEAAGTQEECSVQHRPIDCY